MTKSTLFTAAELKRMAQIANSEGVTVELERDGTIARVMPFTATQYKQHNHSREEEAEAALARWEAGRQKRKSTKDLPDDFAL